MNTRTEEFSINDVSRHDAPKHDATRHSLTIKQASSLLTQLGVPRAPRSVQRFCEMGLIDCVATTGEKGTPRYFVNQQSLESYADELKQLQNISNVGNDMARNDAPERAIARHDAPTITPPGFVEIKKEPDPVVIVLQERVSVLEREKFQLQIDSTARAEVINQMRDQMRERERTWLKQITEQSREIGQLETQVRQLAAPKEDVARHSAPTYETETLAHDPANAMHIVDEAPSNRREEMTRPVATSSDEKEVSPQPVGEGTDRVTVAMQDPVQGAPQPKRSFLGRVFGN